MAVELAEGDPMDTGVCVCGGGGCVCVRPCVHG